MLQRHYTAARLIASCLELNAPRLTLALPLNCCLSLRLQSPLSLES